VIRAPAVSPLAVAGAAALRPALWPDLAPGATLAARLARGFRDPRLAQLFGRYATYVGGSPFRSPAVLGLIWHTEASGVWAVEGGMHALARALDALARRLGVETLYGVAAERILADGEGVTGVALSDGSTRRAAHVVHAGDPAALADGLLGQAAQGAVPRSATEPRSHSAWVWSFAARPSGVPLALHNVFFSDDPAREFGPIAAGRMPERPTLYVCAEDRAEGATPPSPGAPERFEIIMNAPHAAHTAAEAAPQEFETCRRLTFETLGRMGLTFDRLPGPEGLTGPAQFARMFPGSQGAIYGPSPHGTMAAFRRPTARTRLPGLWIAGGGAHPGAGVPMAALSGMHAADAILACRPSIVRSARTATPGGTSMASPTTGPAPSR
jgi:1-hydroxycarotenoid 3,4-desaturase